MEIPSWPTDSESSSGRSARGRTYSLSLSKKPTMVFDNIGVLILGSQSGIATTSTAQLPFKRPHMPTNRDQKRYVGGSRQIQLHLIPWNLT